MSQTTQHEIHPYEIKIQNTLKQCRRDLSEANYDLILKYDMAMIRDTLALATRNKHLEILLSLSRMLKKDWTCVSKDDIDRLVYEIMKKYSMDGKETHTTWDHKKILKIFFRWFKLGSRNFSDVGNPIETDKIKLKRVKNKLVREDLLTDEDIQKILKCTLHPRDRALFSVQAEAGTRPGEILSLRIKDVKLTQYGAKISVDGKTGARNVLIVNSVPDLMTWLDVHPFRGDTTSPLWPVLQQGERYGKAMDWSSVRHQLQDTVRRTGIKKRISMNLFRHSAATKAAKYLTESQLRIRQGWASDSKMPSVYVHLINADVDNAYLSHLGIRSEEIEPALKPKICVICTSPNPIDSELCHRCGKSLDLASAENMQENYETLLKQEVERENHSLRLELDELKNIVKTITSKI